MKKILVTDLMGTLVLDSFAELHYLYGDSNIKDTDGTGYDVKAFDKQFVNIDDKKSIDAEKYENYLLNKPILKLKTFFEPFLKEGNYIYIVSAINNHGCLREIILSKIYELFHEYSNNIFFFESFGHKWFDRMLEHAEGFSKIEKNIAYFDNGMKIHFINEKEQVYDYIEYPCKLYAIGDDANSDLEMLLKCIELGGKSSFIVKNLYNNLYDHKFDLRLEIDKYTCNNFLKWDSPISMAEIMYYNFFKDYNKWSETLGVQDKKVIEKLTAFREKIYKDMACGNLEVMDIVENNLFYEIKHNYNNSIEHDKHINDITMISKIQICPSLLHFVSNNLLNNKSLTLRNNI